MTLASLPAEPPTQLKGVCGVITTPDGHVVAHHADFNNFAPGGMKLLNCQKSRVRDGLAMVFVKRHLTERMTGKLDEHFVMEFWSNAESNGYRMTLIPIGWPDAEVGP